MLPSDRKRLDGAFPLDCLLEVAGWSRWRLARELRASDTQVANWCRGVTYPRWDTVRRICALLRISIVAFPDDAAPGDRLAVIVIQPDAAGQPAASPGRN